jgi:tetratricopeptide (TPR) repeat protein
MGLAYVKSGKFEKAIGAFKKAIEIKPDDGGAYYNINKYIGNE